MPGKRFAFYQNVRVFLACPGDLVAERSRFPRLLETVNNMRAHSLGLHFEPVGWERVIPSFGRPQELINSELETADLVVVMFWNRVGSPSSTTSDRTGTIEEFELARERYGRAERRRPGSAGKPLVWVYFRTPTVFEGDQYDSLVKFRKELEAGKDLFFREYESLEEWEEMFRQHLVAYLDGASRWNIDADLEHMKPELALLTGRFQAEGIYEFGTKMRLMADLDGDGNDETITFYWSHASFSVVISRFDRGVYLSIPEEFHAAMEKSATIHVAVKDVTKDGLPEILIAADGEVAGLVVAVWGYVDNGLSAAQTLSENSFKCLGLINGQFSGSVREGGTIIMPYGSQGLCSQYAWRDGQFQRDEL
jgi:hypothetical protein